MHVIIAAPGLRDDDVDLAGSHRTWVLNISNFPPTQEVTAGTHWNYSSTNSLTRSLSHSYTHARTHFQAALFKITGICFLDSLPYYRRVT